MYFDDYEVGSLVKSHGRTMTEADIVLHAGQTGDFYPHHMDAEFCATQPFGQRIAHGTLILSVAVGMLASGDINEAAMTYGYEAIRFIRPVFIGDTITAHASIAEKREYRKNPENYGLVDEKVEVLNQHGEIVMALTHIYLVSKNPHQG
jgi:acyl dehydratase|tara:strand:+ start:3868 stop:4314 length:447 start_codon:yes stop_codon:yes gene_type:complete